MTNDTFDPFKIDITGRILICQHVGRIEDVQSLKPDTNKTILENDGTTMSFSFAAIGGYDVPYFPWRPYSEKRFVSGERGKDKEGVEEKN